MANTQENWQLFHTKEYTHGSIQKSNLWWVSDHGRIKVTHGHNGKQKIMRTFLTGGHLGSRYLAISINDAPEKYVHKLVANAFLPQPMSGENTIDHIDMNKLNNHVSNLRWTTHADNINSAIAFKKDKSPTQLQQWYQEKEAARVEHLQRNQIIQDVKLNNQLKAVDLRRAGMKLDDISAIIGWNVSTLYRWLKKHMPADEMKSLNHKTGPKK
jgi:hypothetical protein